MNHIEGLAGEFGGHIPAPFIAASLNTTDPEELKSLLRYAEIELARDSDDSGINYCLAHLYAVMPDIPLEFREEIEREKLVVKGREYLMTMTYDDMCRKSLQGKNFEAADDYIRRANMQTYLHSNNPSRATEHFSEALRKSRDRPEYQDVRNGLVAIFVLDERLWGGLQFIAGLYKDQFPKPSSR
ncbi:MAG: hypothetical protein AABX14_04535 [Candidatus Aenigmatarchaeota archaeon]